MACLLRFTIGTLLALCTAAPAHAGPFPTHPRTAVIWPDPACMTVVDRTADPVLALIYTIPYEDLDVTLEEVDDSRRHQFLALCRDHAPYAPLPSWISDDDVDAAAAKGLADYAIGLEDVLETSSEWSGCWTRITGDAERRPISFAAASEPVLWDTTGLPIGPHVVHGYTWEPPFNIWQRRSGVVQVVDDLDPAASPPTLAITLVDDPVVFTGETLPVRGCLRAMDGATLTAAWSTTDEPFEWHAFATDVPVAGDTFELTFTPSDENIGTLVMLRVEITDPMDRQFTAYMSELASLVPSARPEPCDNGFISGCPTTGDDASSSSAADVSSETGSTNSEPASCACTTTAALPPWLLLLVIPRRRRVACSSHFTCSTAASPDTRSP